MFFFLVYWLKKSYFLLWNGSLLRRVFLVWALSTIITNIVITPSINRRGTDFFNRYRFKEETGWKSIFTLLYKAYLTMKVPFSVIHWNNVPLLPECFYFSWTEEKPSTHSCPGPVFEQSLIESGLFKLKNTDRIIFKSDFPEVKYLTFECL